MKSERNEQDAKNGRPSARGVSVVRPDSAAAVSVGLPGQGRDPGEGVRRSANRGRGGWRARARRDPRRGTGPPPVSVDIVSPRALSSFPGLPDFPVFFSLGRFGHGQGCGAEPTEEKTVVSGR